MQMKFLALKPLGRVFFKILYFYLKQRQMSKYTTFFVKEGGGREREKEKKA